jgi:imidazolonepropionase-like amidohydrolase
LTKTPATLLGIYNEVGSLDVGKWANFLISSGPIFNEKDNHFSELGTGHKIRRER